MGTSNLSMSTTEKLSMQNKQTQVVNSKMAVIYSPLQQWRADHQPKFNNPSKQVQTL